MPPVPGELCAGIIPGPSLLALLEPNEVYATLVTVIATTTFLGPLLLKAHYATRRTRELEP